MCFPEMPHPLSARPSVHLGLSKAAAAVRAPGCVRLSAAIGEPRGLALGDRGACFELGAGPVRRERGRQEDLERRALLERNLRSKVQRIRTTRDASAQQRQAENRRRGDSSRIGSLNQAIRGQAIQEISRGGTVLLLDGHRCESSALSLRPAAGHRARRLA